MRQRGFSLPETLCALVLFAAVIILLLNYHRGLQQEAEAQWQTRQLWRYALEQTEPESPSLPDGWSVQKQQISCGDCLCISVTITSPQGRLGQLSKRIRPFPKSNQE
ncbi:prepilin-type N-terminal cleavage/methylation domain-containing protein [Klebsiella sp. BIGb0407]|uniref:prepilin-type N-terminal cleavage/methylation domain-containing protein n=1 Tax=Klebsiella sp. BIGb0407 TaxID=2940603 RepID=UPI002168FF8F|nr:prepilin-type N-terminal cleavage/methylation domain-containing protein [Klebsiella sp. BIGb0407]MCS3430949.1 prepilin peptidase dependent protein C [Klebsiella sp. BIGb0407]